MADLIELLARSFALAGHEDPNEKTGSLLNPDQVIWQDYVPHARAALETLRDFDVMSLKTEYPKPMCFDDAWIEVFEAALASGKPAT